MGGRRKSANTGNAGQPVCTYVEGEKLRLHKGTGQAYFLLPDATGQTRRFWMGRYFADEAKGISSADTLGASARWIREYRIVGGPPASEQDGLSVAGLVAAFLNNVEEELGESTHVVHYRSALEVLTELYGGLPAAEFSPLKLAAVREAMTETDRWSRSTLNAHLGRIRRAFRWGVAHELVPAGVYQALQAVNGVKRGRTNARESKKVRPVPEELVRAVLPHVSRQVSAMIQVQQLSGMRPGEVVTMRPRDIDRSGAVWIYTPESHKTAYLEREREVFLGPKARQILMPFMLRAENAYMFSPSEAEAERLEARRLSRKTPPGIGNVPGTNRKLEPTRGAGERYGTRSYRRAIHRACERAGFAAWNPNQLRHNAATEIRRHHGIEAARVVLGHSDAGVTQVYAEADRELAARIAEEMG
ncbi:MAG: site-specific integrase [bacterium]|nr:site-specific integrase [bacterium]